jgi:hypothetical protein
MYFTIHNTDTSEIGPDLNEVFFQCMDILVIPSLQTTTALSDPHGLCR